MNFLVSDTGILGKNLSAPNENRTYELPFTSSDALPLSYSRPVGARSLKERGHKFYIGLSNKVSSVNHINGLAPTSLM